MTDRRDRYCEFLRDAERHKVNRSTSKRTVYRPSLRKSSRHSFPLTYSCAFTENNTISKSSPEIENPFARQHVRKEQFNAKGSIDIKTKLQLTQLRITRKTRRCNVISRRDAFLLATNASHVVAQFEITFGR